MAEFWYCVKHHRVEAGDEMCPAKDRLGPYPSEAEAGRALEIAEERNEAWESDPAWNDDLTDPDDGPGPAGTR